MTEQENYMAQALALARERLRHVIFLHAYAM